MQNILNAIENDERDVGEISLVVYKSDDDFKAYSDGFVSAAAHRNFTKKTIKKLRARYPGIKVVECEYNLAAFNNWRIKNPNKTPAQWAAEQPTLWRCGLSIAPSERAGYAIGWVAIGLKNER